jgi:hypothetical protein
MRDPLTRTEPAASLLVLRFQNSFAHEQDKAQKGFMSKIKEARDTTATKVKKSEFVGKGALVQLIGVVCCFLLFPFGIIPGMILLIVGSRMAFCFRCSNCGNKVEKESRICPHPNCGAAFEE